MLGQNFKTRFDFRPTEKLQGALILLSDTFPVLDRLFRALPYTAIDSHQYAIALLVRIRWNAWGAYHALNDLEPFNAAPLVRSAFESLIYMKAALKDNQTFREIVDSDLVRHRRLEASLMIAKDKLNRNERFQKNDMPRFSGKRISIEQLAQKVGLELYWHYYHLLSAETHPSPLHIYKTCVVTSPEGRRYVNVNPVPAFSETLALILVHTLLNGTRVVTNLGNMIGFGEDIDKLFVGYENVLRMKGDDIIKSSAY